MPTRRWMYIAPVSFFFVFLELAILLGHNGDALTGVEWASEELNGKFFIFLALMMGQAGLWGYITCLFGEWLVQIRAVCREGPSLCRLPRHYRWAITIRFVAACASVVVWYFIVLLMRPDWDLGAFGKLHISKAGLLGFLPGVIGVSGMWAVEIAVYSSLPLAVPISRAQVNCYLKLREYLGNFLTSTAIVLVLGTLDVNASRDLIKTACDRNFFPRDLVILFGGVFTVLLGMAYAPAYLALRNLGCQIRDSIIPEIAPSPPHPVSDKDDGFTLLNTWAANREKLTDLLNLDIRDWKSFGPQFAIVAPLATGIATHLIGK